MLQVTSGEPLWLDLPGRVRLQVRPCGPAIMGAAQAATRLRLGEALEAEPDLDSATREGLSRGLLAEELARRGAVAWEGVAGPDEAPAAFSPAAVAALMSRYWRIADAFIAAYTSELDEATAEGNG